MDADLPSPGWCVEITGNADDLEEWAYDVKAPFDPWLEQIERQGRRVTLLRSCGFGEVEDAAGAQAKGAALLEQLQGTMRVLTGHRGEVQLGGSVFIEEDGTPKIHYFLKPEPLVIRMRMGRPTLTAYDANGQIIPPPPPTASVPQKWIKAGEQNDAIADLLVFVARADNWFDLYKAYEVACEIVEGEKELARCTGLSMKKLAKFRQTANHYRHSGRRDKLPRNPPTLPEAIATLRTISGQLLNELVSDS